MNAAENTQANMVEQEMRHLSLAPISRNNDEPMSSATGEIMVHDPDIRIVNARIASPDNNFTPGPSNVPPVSVTPLYRSNIRMSSEVLARYPWSTDAIIVHGSLSETFSNDHWLQTLLRSLASAEDALQYNHTGDWVAMRELLVDIVSNQDSSHKSVKSTEDLHLQPRNKKSWTLCALISAYRLVDIAKMVENLPNRISVPLHVRQKVLFKETHKFWERLYDWPSLISRFMTNAKALKPDMLNIALQDTSNLHSIFLTTLYNLRSTSAISKTMFNLQLAALHISYITKREFDREIPDLPMDSRAMIYSIMSDEELTDTKKDFFDKMSTKYTSQQLRLPLQMALVISPIILLSPSELHKGAWDRKNLILTAKAMGNNKPPEISLIETDIWKGLFSLARGEINVYSLVFDLQQRFALFDIEAVSSLKNWFHPGDYGDGDHISFRISNRTLMSFDVQKPVDPRWPMAEKLILNDFVATSSEFLDKRKGKQKISSPTNHDEDDNNDNAVPANDMLPSTSQAQVSMDVDEPNDSTNAMVARSSDRIRNQPRQIAWNPSFSASNERKKRKKPIHRKKSLVLGVGDRELSIDSTTAGTVIYKPIIIEDLESERRIQTLKFGPPKPRISLHKNRQGICVDRFSVWDAEDAYQVFPKLHHQSELDDLYKFQEGVEQFYHKQDNIPIHLAHPDASVWAMISWDTFDGLTSKEVMDLTQTQHLYITDIAASPVDFDRQALRHLKSLDAVVKIEDQSAEYGSNGRFVEGSLQQILQNASDDDGAILLASHIAMPRASVEISTFSSDVYAWNETEGEPYCKETEHVPTGDIRWGRASTMGAFTGWTLIPDGFGAVLDIKAGSEWLVVARPPSSKVDKYEPLIDHFGDINLFLDDFDPRNCRPDKWHIEAMYLGTNTRVILRPNTLYAMHTTEHSICHGSYFYSITTIQDTFCGMVHGFINHQIPTADVSSSRYLLQRMLIHCYRAYSNAGFNAEDMPHVPHLESTKSLLDLLTLSLIVILSNVLDPRTYRYHGQGDKKIEDISEDIIQKMGLYDLNDMNTVDRRRCIFVRGLAWHVLAWVQTTLEVIDGEDGTVLDFANDVMAPFFRSQARGILTYKAKALKAQIQGTDGCTYEALQNQMTACFEETFAAEDDEDLHEFKEVENLRYVALDGASIRRKNHIPLLPITKSKALDVGFTAADKLYWKGLKCNFMTPLNPDDSNSEDHLIDKRAKTQ